MTTSILESTRQTTNQIIEQLPCSEYTKSCQPIFDDQSALSSAIGKLLEIPGVTNPEQVLALRDRLGAIALGEDGSRVVVAGRCAEPVSDSPRLSDQLAEEAIDITEAVDSILPGSLVILRSRGQNTKPRSSATETLPSGVVVPSFMGEAVNGTSPDDRMPDPSRMVAATLQALRLERAITDLNGGKHVAAAHEALLLPLEQSQVETINGANYLVSADLPWIGNRTNDPTGDHVELLSKIENPVGIKIGPGFDPANIKRLSDKLNPLRIPGKLTLMLRLGRANTAEIGSILDQIKISEPNAVIMWDIHGTTTVNKITGQKIRSVAKMSQEITGLSQICRQHGLRLHGIHIEAQGDDSRLECVDSDEQLPTHPGNVDPQLNLRQLRSLLTGSTI